MATNPHVDLDYDGKPYQACSDCSCQGILNMTTCGRRPKLVTLCGSARFQAAYQLAYENEYAAGHMVLSIACMWPEHAQGDTHATPELAQTTKAMLDYLHIHKIRMSDEVLVLNVDGYVGDSTRKEVRYALLLGKRIRWLVPYVVVSDGKITPAQFLVRLRVSPDTGAPVRYQPGSDLTDVAP